MQVIYGVNAAYVLPALVSIYSLWKNASQPVDITTLCRWDHGTESVRDSGRQTTRCGLVHSGEGLQCCGIAGELRQSTVSDSQSAPPPATEPREGTMPVY